MQENDTIGRRINPNITVFYGDFLLLEVVIEISLHDVLLDRSCSYKPLLKVLVHHEFTPIY